MSSMNVAVFAGTFDPFTKSHLYIYNQAKQLFNQVVILLADNPSKTRSVNPHIMADVIREVAGLGHVKIDDGLVANVCREIADFYKADNMYLVRGLRNTSDYMYEEGLAKVNLELNNDLKTVYFRADNDIISSSMVRLLNAHGEDVSKYLPYEPGRIGW